MQSKEVDWSGLAFALQVPFALPPFIFPESTYSSEIFQRRRSQYSRSSRSCTCGSWPLSVVETRPYKATRVADVIADLLRMLRLGAGRLVAEDLRRADRADKMCQGLREGIRPW